MDILAALEDLEEKEREKKQKARGKSQKKPQTTAARNAEKNAKAGQRPPLRSRSQASNRSAGASSVPSSSQPSGLDALRNAFGRTTGGDVTTPSRVGAQSPALSDTRRISFSEPTRPEGSKLWIPTKSDSLASGFDYDSRLTKYGVSEKEWKHFSGELVEAANVPSPSWLWTFRKKEVMKRIKRDLQYNGDVNKIFKKWNQIFKMQRFQAWLELPGQRSAMMAGNDVNEKIDVAKFRVVITPNSERPPSVYSRSNSLTRSVTGEGIQAVKGRVSTEAQD